MLSKRLGVFCILLVRTSLSRRLVTTQGLGVTNPNVWADQWVKIEHMRKVYPAAVDSKGAEPLAKENNATGAVFRFQTLAATMLSPQTKDEQNAESFRNLVNLVAPLPLNAQALAEKTESEVFEAIKQVSFARVKTKNILEAAKTCVDKYNGDIPSNINNLFSFKGVGPKVGYLTFSIAWGKDEGICVDTHVHRIANRLKWVDSITSGKSSDREKTRIQLGE